MTNCPFEVGDRVLAPVDGGETMTAATVMAHRVYKTRSIIEGYAETRTQVLVEFDEAQFQQTWILCDACQPLTDT